MTDNELNALIVAQVKPAMQAQAGLSAVKLLQNYQSRQQGAPSGDAVFFMKLFDKKIGSPKRQSKKADPVATVFENSLIQQYETTYQFAAWVQQNPADVAGLTESDVLCIVSDIIQTDEMLAAFRAAGAGIQRVMQVRNPYIQDDRDRFAATPTFDIVFSHKRIVTKTIPKVVTYEANITRV